MGLSNLPHSKRCHAHAVPKFERIEKRIKVHEEANTRGIRKKKRKGKKRTCSYDLLYFRRFQNSFISFDSKICRQNSIQ